MALVISRKPHENILIGDDIKIGIVSVKEGNRVSVAITAPKEVKIVREEIAEGNGGQDSDVDLIILPTP